MTSKCSSVCHVYVSYHSTFFHTWLFAIGSRASGILHLFIVRFDSVWKLLSLGKASVYEYFMPQ